MPLLASCRRANGAIEPRWLEISRCEATPWQVSLGRWEGCLESLKKLFSGRTLSPSVSDIVE